MPHPTHFRDAPRRLDGLARRAAGAQVVQHAAAGRAAQLSGGQQRRHEVGGDGAAALVHEDRPVRVAVERHAEVGTAALHRLADIAQVLLPQRIGLVVRKVAVGIEVEALHTQRKTGQERLETDRGHAVAAVDGDVQLRAGKGCDPCHVLRIPLRESHRGDRSAAPCRRIACHGPGDGLDLREAGVGADRNGVLAAELEAVVAGRIVRGRETHATGRPMTLHAEVHHRCRGEPRIEDVGALIAEPAHQGLAQLGRAGTRIAPHEHRGGPQEARHGPADGVGVLRAELLANHAADVVGLENGHGGAP